MKISKENIKEIESWVTQLCKNIDYFNEDSFECEEGDESIYVGLPGDDQGESLEVEEFLNFGWEMSGFKIIDNGRIQTTTLTYQIIKAESEDLEYYLKNTSDQSATLVLKFASGNYVYTNRIYRQWCTCEEIVR